MRIETSSLLLTPLSEGYARRQFVVNSKRRAPPSSRLTHVIKRDDIGGRVPVAGTIDHMTNLASVLKSEVARLARKEVRAETETLKKTVATQRSEVAALKRRTSELEKAVKALFPMSAQKRRSSETEVSEAETGQFRFRASGMASNRKRLGLSADDFGLLVGTSGQSIYNWESGKTRPRASHLSAIAALRSLGKKAAAERVATLREAQ